MSQEHSPATDCSLSTELRGAAERNNSIGRHNTALLFIQAADEIDRLRAGWIESDEIALEARVAEAARSETPFKTCDGCATPQICNLSAVCRTTPSATPRSLDEERWKFCMKHGFPKACFNPEREVSYFYIRADVCDDTSFGWDTPEKAVDATMKAIKERDEAAARWQQETRT